MQIFSAPKPAFCAGELLQGGCDACAADDGNRRTATRNQRSKLSQHLGPRPTPTQAANLRCEKTSVSTNSVDRLISAVAGGAGRNGAYSLRSDNFEDQIPTASSSSLPRLPWIGRVPRLLIGPSRCRSRQTPCSRQTSSDCLAQRAAAHADRQEEAHST